jgi:hypothetical protein
LRAYRPVRRPPAKGEILADLHHSALAIQARQVDGEPQETGVNRAARHQQQPGAVGKAAAKLEADQSWPETIGQDQLGNDDFSAVPPARKIKRIRDSNMGRGGWFLEYAARDVDPALP